MEARSFYAFLIIAAALYMAACAKSPIPPEGAETETPQPPESLNRTWGLVDIIPSSEDAPPKVPYDGTGISVDVLSGAIAPPPNGSGRIVVHYKNSCDFSAGPLDFQGLFLRREDDWDLQSWPRLQGADWTVKRGEVTEIVELPDSTPPGSDYVVTVYYQTSRGGKCWGNSNPFPIYSSTEERDFRVIRPHRRAQWQKGTHQTIIWSFANLNMAVGDRNLEDAFKVELVNGIEFSDGIEHSIWEIPSEDISCHAPSRLCSLPWNIPDDISTGSYRIRVTPVPSVDPDAVFLQPEWSLHICDDCATGEVLTDVSVTRVEILTADGSSYDTAEVDYYTDSGTTSIQFNAHVGWNGEYPSHNCALTVFSYLGTRVDGVDVFRTTKENATTGPSVGYLGDRLAIHSGISLPTGLTPGDTIPIRVKLILGHTQLPEDIRDPLEACEPEENMENNTYDFSVTLRDAGSRE